MHANAPTRATTTAMTMKLTVGAAAEQFCESKFVGHKLANDLMVAIFITLTALVGLLGLIGLLALSGALACLSLLYLSNLRGAGWRELENLLTRPSIYLLLCVSFEMMICFLSRKVSYLMGPKFIGAGAKKG